MSVIKSNRPRASMNVLDQRIPRNSKYENVQAKIDTGDSLTKFLKQHEDFRTPNKQFEELFPRIKISTLVKLIIQVAEIDPLKNAQFDYTESQQSFPSTHRSRRQDSLDTTRSTLEGFVRGVGEMDLYRSYQNEFSSSSSISLHKQIDRESIDQPYLIVDLRDNDEFKTNHIISAHHYPAAMLSRCSNNDSKELLIYKNQKGKIIILYDEDERIASQAATIMVERGYNNIFLLSGGLRQAVRKYPRGLLTGTCPLSWTGSNRSTTGKITFPTREKFTQHDIEELNTLLEKNSISNDIGSRLSRSPASKQISRSTASKQISRSSNASYRFAKPWKP